MWGVRTTNKVKGIASSFLIAGSKSHAGMPAAAQAAGLVIKNGGGGINFGSGNMFNRININGVNR
jgi:hypothetical protein